MSQISRSRLKVEGGVQGQASSTTPRLLAKWAVRLLSQTHSASRISAANCSSCFERQPFRSAGESIVGSSSSINDSFPERTGPGLPILRPAGPKGASAGKPRRSAVPARAAAVFNADRARERSTYPARRLCPTRLPSAAAIPRTSSRSSVIWKARPTGGRRSRARAVAVHWPRLSRAPSRSERPETSPRSCGDGSIPAPPSRPGPARRPDRRPGRRPAAGPAASARTAQHVAAKAGRAIVPGQHFKSQGQQRIARQDGRRLVELLWHVGRPRRKSSSSMAGRSSWISE